MSLLYRPPQSKHRDNSLSAPLQVQVTTTSASSPVETQNKLIDNIVLGLRFIAARNLTRIEEAPRFVAHLPFRLQNRLVAGWIDKIKRLFFDTIKKNVPWALQTLGWIDYSQVELQKCEEILVELCNKGFLNLDDEQKAALSICAPVRHMYYHNNITIPTSTITKMAAAGKISREVTSESAEFCWFTVLAERLKDLRPQLQELQICGKSAAGIEISDEHLTLLYELAPCIEVRFPTLNGEGPMAENMATSLVQENTSTEITSGEMEEAVSQVQDNVSATGFTSNAGERLSFQEKTSTKVTRDAVGHATVVVANQTYVVPARRKT